MVKGKKVKKEDLQKRWLLDFTSDQKVYVPEAMAKPARIREGFELRTDGTYCQIGSGADDKTVETEGTWCLDEDGVLTLSPQAESGKRRKIRIVEADEEKLVVKE